MGLAAQEGLVRRAEAHAHPHLALPPVKGGSVSGAGWLASTGGSGHRVGPHHSSGHYSGGGRPVPTVWASRTLRWEGHTLVKCRGISSLSLLVCLFLII